MKINKLLGLVRELMPTPFSDDVLLMWLSNCENSILTEVCLLSPEECTEIASAGDAELLVPHPYDKLYLPYMQAQICHANGETDKYMNFMALYNTYRDEFAREITQNVNPGNGGAVRMGYYLSAYNIAKLHGFTGSEAEWLESLHGEPGPQGPQGARGQKGETGERGENGATFTPLLDEDGMLSWSNDAGLINPLPINIRGPAGLGFEDKSLGFQQQTEYTEAFPYLRALGAGSWEVKKSTELYRVMAVDGGGTMYRTEMLLPDDGIPSYRIYAGEKCIFTYDGGDLPALDGKRLLNETVVPVPTQENAGQVLIVDPNGKSRWESAVFKINSGKVNTLYTASEKVGGVDAEGVEWYQEEAGAVMDEPYLKEYGYQCCVEESTGENHNQPVEIYKWLYRCIKEGFSVPKRTIVFKGHTYEFNTDGGTTIAEMDFSSDPDFRVLKIPLVQFPMVTQEQLTRYIYRVQQDNPLLFFPFWPQMEPILAVENEADNGYLYFYSAMPTNEKVAEMRETCKAHAEAVKDKIYYLYGISPGDTLTTADRCKVAKVIHDYMIMNSNFSDKTAPYWSSTMYPVFSNDKSLCNSYTQAFNYLARMYDIEALFVGGRAKLGDDSGGHAWVMLRVGGDYEYGSYACTSEVDWTCIDVWWDEPKHDDATAEEAGVIWKYFMNYDNLFSVVDPDQSGYRAFRTDIGYGKYPTQTPQGNYPYTGNTIYYWEE